MIWNEIKYFFISLKKIFQFVKHKQSTAIIKASILLSESICNNASFGTFCTPIGQLFESHLDIGLAGNLPAKIYE